MSLQWSKIWEGFRNDWLPPKELKDLIRKTQEERLAICLNCPFNSTRGRVNGLSKCLACGCFLTKKTACLSCECGIAELIKENPSLPKLTPLWGPVLTEEQEEQIANKIKQQTNESDNI